MYVIIGGRGWMRDDSARPFMWPDDCLGGTRQQPVTMTHREQLQMNSLQQQPLSSPAATRSASTRNQPANSFRSELWGGGEGRGVCGLIVVIVMLCNWQVCLNPVSDANITPPTLRSDNKHVHVQHEREKTCRDDGAIQGWRGYSFG